MFFVIQKEEGKNYNDIEFAILMDVLDAYKHDHEYVTMKVDDFYADEDDFLLSERKLKSADEFDERIKTGIPIGEISFVEKWLNIFHGIEYENAIEIPPVLRTREFLKRKYSIVPAYEIPRTGYHFIKDASRQKQFAKAGNVEEFIFDEMFEPKTDEFDMSVRFDYEHLYQVSEIVNILSEYRVYVFQGEINQVSCYKGDPLVFPDAELIKKAVSTYAKEVDSPKSFSLDVMVTDRGTCIGEVHNFTSIGLYGVDWDDSLLFAYKDGIDYILNVNKPQTECVVD